MSLPIGVRYVSAPPGDGYGSSAQGYLATLEALGVAVTWEPMDFVSERPLALSEAQSRFAGWIGRRLEHDTVIVHLPPDRVPRHLAAERRCLRVAVTTAETDPIPDLWVSALAAVDRVVVPSTFNQQVFAASGVSPPIAVVPHVSDLPADAAPFAHDALGDRFVFYSIGPWTTRKGLAESVSAFADAFAGSDEVALVLKTSLIDQQTMLDARRGTADHPVRVETWWSLAQLLATRPSAPPVLLVTEVWDDAQIAGLHARGDCLLSLNRGEGFGLTVLDAALAGNPTVITGWGGALDIVGHDWPLLVSYRLVATADDRPDDWMRPHPDQRWAVADHDDAVDRLRWVFEHPAQARRLGATAAARAEATCGRAAVASALAAALDH